MADSKRQQLVNAVKTRLTLIRTANGYETEAGLYVFEWTDYAVPETQRPCLIVRDGLSSASLTHGKDWHVLEITIDALAHGSGAPTLVRKVVADVIQAWATDKTFGALADNSWYRGDVLEAEQESRRLLGAQLRFDVEYKTDHMDPYN